MGSLVLFPVFLLLWAPTCKGQDVIVSSQADFNQLSGLTFINGSLLVGSRDCSLPCEVNTAAPGPVADTIQRVEGSILIQCCPSIVLLDGFKNLISLGGDLVIHNNQELISITEGVFQKLIEVRNVRISQNRKLLGVSGLSALERVNGYLSLERNAALTGFGGLGALTSIMGQEVVAGSALSLLYNPMLSSLDGLRSLREIAYGSVHVEGNTALCYSGYPVWKEGSFDRRPEGGGGDKGIDWRTKLNLQLTWQYSWVNGSIPSLVVRNNADLQSCDTASCHENCNQFAGCLGPNSTSLCGSCVTDPSVGLEDTCLTGPAQRPASCDSIPYWPPTEFPYSLVFGVFFAFLGILLLCGAAACVYGIYRLCKRLKLKQQGSFDVNLNVGSVGSGLDLIPSSTSNTSTASARQRTGWGSRARSGVIASLNSADASSRLPLSSGGVVMSSYKPKSDDEISLDIDSSILGTDDSSNRELQPKNASADHGLIEGRKSPRYQYQSQTLPRSAKPNTTPSSASPSSPGGLERAGASDARPTAPRKAANKTKKARDNGEGIVMFSYKKETSDFFEDTPGATDGVDEGDGYAAATVTVSMAPVISAGERKQRQQEQRGTKQQLNVPAPVSPRRSKSYPASFEDAEIPMTFPSSQVKVGKELGSAPFGKVYQADTRNLLVEQKKTTVVVKQLKKGSSSVERERFLQPVEAMKKLKHKNVLALLGVSRDGPNLMVLLEYCANGNFKTFLLRHRSEPSVLWTGNLLLHMACDMAAGLLYLHTKKVAHNDLATRSCLVTGENKVKVGDYGLSRQTFKEDYYSRGPSQKGWPVRWMAPEQIVVQGKNILDSMPASIPGNIWSFGIALWEVCSFAEWPYEEFSNEEVIQALKSTKKCCLENPLPANSSATQLYDIMQWCWGPMDQRPSMEKVYEQLQYVLHGRKLSLPKPGRVAPAKTAPPKSANVQLDPKLKGPPLNNKGRGDAQEQPKRPLRSAPAAPRKAPPPPGKARPPSQRGERAKLLRGQQRPSSPSSEDSLSSFRPSSSSSTTSPTSPTSPPPLLSEGEGEDDDVFILEPPANFSQTSTQQEPGALTRSDKMVFDEQLSPEEDSDQPFDERDALQEDDVPLQEDDIPSPSTVYDEDVAALLW